MERDLDHYRVGEVMPTTIDEILQQLDAVNLDGMTVADKARLYKELSKKFGLESGMNVQTLGGSQMIGNTIQFNLCDRSALPELIDKLVEKLGKEAVTELIKILLQKI
jgi:hypothetical protein